MNEFDTTLKSLFQRSTTGALRELTGDTVVRWLNVELPRVQNPRVDLLGETPDGNLVHVEFQSRNDPAMVHRMAEYYLAIYRQLKKYPRQTCVFVGEEPLRMKDTLDSPAMSFHYRMVDIRDLNGDVLLDSSNVEDNILAILTRLSNPQAAIRRILERIDACEPAEREIVLQQVLVIAGLRHLEQMIEEEVKRMPFEIDILENKVLGREYKRGIEEGIREGLEQGIQEGKNKGFHEGELTVLRGQMLKRFGPLPAWAEAKLLSSSPSEILDMALRLFDAQSLEDVVK